MEERKRKHNVAPLPGDFGARKPSMNGIAERKITSRESLDVDKNAQLGRGGESVVYMASALLESKGKLRRKRVAVKVVAGPCSGELTKLIGILRCHRDTTVKIHSQLPGVDDTWIVMELMEHNSIAQVIERYNTEINIDGTRPIATEVPDVIKSVAYQCLSALEWMHAAKVLHRDVKPDNFLVNKKGEVKLSDFGTARFEKTLGEVRTYCGTSFYFSPERLEEGPYSNKGDIWGLGVLLLELLMCRRLFPEFAHSDLFAVIGKMRSLADDLPSDIPPATAGFLRHMLRLDPESRRSAEELLDLPFITDDITCRDDALCIMRTFLDAINRRKGARRAAVAAAIALIH